MLKTDREIKICKKYSKRDENHFVHCKECPLVKDHEDMICKAIAHYDRHERKWVLDEHLVEQLPFNEAYYEEGFYDE